MFFIYVLFFAASCLKNGKYENPDEKKNEKSVLNNKILLILGEDYQARAGILNCFKAKYTEQSIAENLNVLRYSDFFENTKRARLKTVMEHIDSISPSILISLGIPEGAGKYLLQAAEQYPLLTIISLLPMEEILPLEASSDIVVDFELPDEILNQESDFKISNEDVSLLILTSVFCGEDINAVQKRISTFPIEEFRKSFSKAAKLLRIESKTYSLKPYIDPETGISSYKYLMIYELINKEDEEFNIFKKEFEGAGRR